MRVRQPRGETKEALLAGIRNHAHEHPDQPYLNTAATNAFVNKSISYVKSLLYDLEAEGLIKRTPDPRDRRGQLWTIDESNST